MVRLSLLKFGSFFTARGRGGRGGFRGGRGGGPGGPPGRGRPY